MLTDEQKQKIREEEIFRQEIRIQLLKKESSPSKLEKFWNLLNSAIFLWFLSTIAVGTLTFLYQKWDEKRLLNRTRQQTVRKIDIEISSRLRFFNNQIQSKMRKDEALLILENPSKSNFPSGVFPEFKERTLRALLWELVSLVPQEKKQEIYQALMLADNLRKIFTDLVNPHDKLYLNVSVKVDSALDDFFADVDEAEGKGSSSGIDTARLSEHEIESAKVDQDLANFFSFVDVRGDSGKGNSSGINAEKLSKHEIESSDDLIITFDLTKLKSSSTLYGVIISSFNLERWGYPFQTLKEKIDKVVKEKEDKALKEKKDVTSNSHR